MKNQPRAFLIYTVRSPEAKYKLKAVIKIIHAFEKISNTGFRGRCVQKFLYGLLKIIHPRAKRIDDNLKLVYPNHDKAWRKKMRSEIYKQFAWTITELLALQRDHSQVFEWVKKVEGIEIFDDVIKNKRGAIYLACHFGNWELLGSWYAQYAKKHGHELSSMYQEIHDPDFNEYIHEMRLRSSMKLLPKDLSIPKLTRLLKNGENIAILNDVSGSTKMIVPFLGHNATNISGPAVLSLLSGVPIIPVGIFRIKPFEHVIKVFEPLEIPDKSLNHEERVKKLVIESNDALAKIILSRPELWFWLHNRWKNVNL